MKKEERDEHLDKIFGIEKEEEKKQEIVMKEETDNVPVIENYKDGDLKKDLMNNKIRLNTVYQKLDDVLQSHTDVAVDFAKSRDVEAVAKVASVMVSLQKELRETSRDYHKKPEEEEGKKQNNTQNNFFVGSKRELIDLLNGKDIDENKDK